MSLQTDGAAGYPLLMENDVEALVNGAWHHFFWAILIIPSTYPCCSPYASDMEGSKMMQMYVRIIALSSSVALSPEVD